jgi:curved DNA-binding protein CbpA
MKNQDLYKILGVHPQESDENIRAAWRKLCSTYHPDKHAEGPDKQAAADMMADINAAYEILGNPESRAKYDSGEMFKEKDPYDAVYPMAMGYFDAIIAAMPPQMITDIFKMIQDAIDHDKVSTSAQITKAEKDIKRMKKFSDRINCDGAVSNLFADVLGIRVKKSMEYIEGAKVRLGNLDLCKQFIQHFSDLGYMPDRDEMWAPSPGTTGTHTINNSTFINLPGNGITFR